MRPRGEEKIPRNLALSNFEEKLREIDATISESNTKLADLPLPNHTPTCEENKVRFLEFKKLNVKEDELKKSVDLWVGPTSKVDKAFTDLVPALPNPNKYFNGPSFKLSPSPIFYRTL
nr:hypothetical protein CFP56_67314 [Quercus suber]